jgi:hypothetical protein
MTTEIYPSPDLMALLYPYLLPSDHLRTYAGEYPIRIAEKLRLFEATVQALEGNPSLSAKRILDAFVYTCLGIAA